MEAGADPHPKVKESAKAAMSEIASVIKNPELSRLSPVLLAALGDPGRDFSSSLLIHLNVIPSYLLYRKSVANKTKDALEALLEMEFMHFIDAPSLALLAPVLGRALRDRAADLKRKASVITGTPTFL